MTNTSNDQVPGQESLGDQQAATGSKTGDPVGGMSKVDSAGDAIPESVAEALSALVDGEATELEVRRLLKAAESDPAILARWQRFQLVRAVVKGEYADPQFDVCARVRGAIDAEEALTEKPLTSAEESRGGPFGGIKKWGEGLGKVAVAASVAVAFVVGVQQFGPASNTGAVHTADAAQDVPATATAGLNSAPAGFELPAFSARTVSTQQTPAWSVRPQTSGLPAQAGAQMQLQTNQALQNHFETMLFRHAERSSSTGGMGLLPFARVSRMDVVEENNTQDATPE